MAEEDENPDTDEENEDAEGDGEEGEGGGKKKLAGKKLVLFVVAPLLVLGIAGGAGWYFFMSGGEEDELAEGEVAEEEVADLSNVFFYDLPEMLVNLNTNGQTGPSYLKLSVAIELEGEESVAIIEPLLPRIVDRFQVYLRELRVADLSGSAGMYQLKNELLRRINSAVPVEVKDVLFKEMIVQ